MWNLECLQKHYVQKRGPYLFNTAHFGEEREKIFILMNVQTGVLCFYKVRFSMFTLKKVLKLRVRIVKCDCKCSYISPSFCRGFKYWYELSLLTLAKLFLNSLQWLWCAKTSPPLPGWPCSWMRWCRGLRHMPIKSSLRSQNLWHR